MDGFDTHFPKLFRRARVEPWQIADVVIRKWQIASVIELARNGMGAMTARLDVRRCGHRQNCECRPKLECQFRLEPHYLPCDVPNPKETPRIDAAAPENIRAVDMRQTAGTNVQPRPRDNAVLNTKVIKMLLFNRCRGLDFDESPATVLTSMQDVHAHQHTSVFKSRFKDCRDFPVGDQLAGRSDRLIETVVA